MSRRHLHRPYHSTSKALLQSQMLRLPSGRDPLKGRHVISHVSEPLPLSRRGIRSGLLRRIGGLVTFVTNAVRLSVTFEHHIKMAKYVTKVQ